MPFSSYNKDYFHIDGNGNIGYFGMTIRKNSKYEYIKDKECINIYEDKSVLPKKLSLNNLQEFLDACKEKEAIAIEIKETKTDKFTVSKLLKQMNINQISITYGCSRAIKEHKNREVIAYSLGLFGGLIITNKFNERNGYTAYKFVIMDEKHGRAIFSNMDLIKAITYLKTARELGYFTVFSKEVENKLNSYTFLKSI